MPIYEYRCEKCGRLTEVMQKASAAPPPACPRCGGTRLTKVVSRTAFRLKGGGWYADLYGPPKKSGPGTTEKKEPGKKEPGASHAGAEKTGGPAGKKAAKKDG